MKRFAVLITLLFIAIFLTSCFLENPVNQIDGLLGGEELLSEEDEPGVMPDDIISDVSRSTSKSFKFETVLPVQLAINADFYSAELVPQESVKREVLVLLEDGSGNAVYGGMSDKNGVLNAEIRLPGAPEDMTLHLHAEGYESRKVVIADMVSYEEINRTMGMAAVPNASREISGLTDSDGDGVPDVYDAYPDDSDSAFAYLMPAEGYLTVAYEDLFGRAQAGDADYNDFIAHYDIEEASNSEGITEIKVSAEAAVKLAGYNHTFGIRINYFEPPVDLKVNYIDEYGNPASYSTRIKTYPIPGETALEIMLFEHTGKAAGQSADFTLDFVVQGENKKNSINNPQDPELLSRPPYNPYLYVLNTGHDVHLIDEKPLAGSLNPADTFRDGDGFPWALLVPPGPREEGGWAYPGEGVRIEEPYPRFTRWRKSGGVLSPDWYLHDTPWEPPVANSLLFASDRDGDMEIYSINLDTDTLTQLTSNNAVDKHPALSADGTKIAFVSDSSGGWAIHTMSIDGTGVSGVLASLSRSFDGHPSWSPDGMNIVYDSGSEIYRMHADGTGQTNLTSTVFTNEFDPSWSPDGDRIAYSSSADGDYDIYLMNSDGSTPLKLTDNTDVDQEPSWSPDGTQIVFSSGDGGNFDLVTVNTDGSNPVNLTGTSGETETSPSWSENGIAFAKGNEIYTLDPGTAGSEVNITNHPSVDQDPAW